MGLFTKNDKKVIEATDKAVNERLKECAEEVSKVLTKHNCRLEILVKLNNPLK